MRHDVCVMDNAISFRNLSSKVRGECLASYSWLSKCVELIDMAEQILDIQSCNGCKSWSQTISSHEYLCISVQSSQSLELIPDIDFNSCECIVETLMDHAARAQRKRDLHKWVFYLGSVEVDNPILNADSAPECHNNSIIDSGVSGVSKYISNRVVEGFGLFLRKFITLVSL